MLISDFHVIGERLYTVRKRLGLTQSEVAELAGLSDRTYADIEWGNVNMRIGTLVQICSALHITPNDILVIENRSLTNHKDEVLEIMKSCTQSEQETCLDLLSVYLHSLHE